jgi:hypothetical protein
MNLATEMKNVRESRLRNPVTVRAALIGHKNRNPNLSLLPFAAPRFAKLLKKGKFWRKRVGVEPTIHPAKGRIAGFEDREDHRTPCASGAIIRGRSSAINFWRHRDQFFWEVAKAIASTNSRTRGSVQTS